MKRIPKALLEAMVAARERTIVVADTAQRTIAASPYPDRAHGYMSLYLENALNTAVDMKDSFLNGTLTMGHITALNMDMDEIVSAMLKLATGDY